MDFLKTLLFLIFLTTVIMACQDGTSANANSTQSALPEKASFLHLLFFKKEQKMELWATDENSNLLQIRLDSVAQFKETPLGIFQLNLDNAPLFVLESPNDFYDQKIGQNQFQDIYLINEVNINTNRQSIVIPKKSLQNLASLFQKKLNTKVYVFPNDIRSGGSFEPCFACPHRVAELYSSLELHLNQFVSN